MTTTARDMTPQLNAKRVIGAVVVIVLLVAMALDTTVVPTGSAVAAPEQFSAQAFGAKMFPKVQDIVTQQAVPATQLASAVLKDKAAAVDQYAIGTGSAPVMAVKFTGVLGKSMLGTYTVKIDSVPDTVTLKVQTGPAIIGTALRDAHPDIQFGDFKNQIEYQNAAAGINSAMEKAILADVTGKKLTGRTVTVVGAFKLNNSSTWKVTPVHFSVQQ